MSDSSDVCHIRPDLLEKNYGSASNLKFNEVIKARQAQGELIHHFGFGQAPFPVVERAAEALKKYVGENAYLSVKGIPKLREGICRFHRHYDQLDFTADQVVVAPGSKELILLLITIFKGDVLINSPSWTTYKPQAVLAGRSPLLVDSEEKNGWRVTPQALEKVLQTPGISKYKVFIFTNPCNPTGTAYTEDQLQELVSVFRKHNVIVLSDEIYGRLHYAHRHVALPKLYPEGAILSSGFSKWASAGGWRLGYHIFPKELNHLMATVSSAGSHSYSCAPAPMQYAIAELLEDIEACDEYISHTTRIMRTVGEFCARELRSVGVTVVEPRAGYYIFPNFEVIRPALCAQGANTGHDMCQLMLHQARVATLAGGPHHLRPVDELTVRLCYVNFDGGPSLAESRRCGLNNQLDETFVKEFCKPVYDGIEALKAWVVGLTVLNNDALSSL